MSERLKTILALASLGLFVLAADACVRSVLPPTLRFHSHKGKLLLVCMSVDKATRVEQTSTGSDAGSVTPAKKN